MPDAPPNHALKPASAPQHLTGKERWGRGRGGRPWRRIRERIIKRDQGLCLACKAAGRLTAATQVDHIVPKSQGGTDSTDNLQSLCRPCHAAKTRREGGSKV